jgi:hypothetical protein
VPKLALKWLISVILTAEMRNLLYIFFALCLGITACTGECEEPDIQAINALYFELQQGGEGGFTDEELDAVYFVRFVPFSQPLIADTFYAQGNYPLGEGRFLINDQYPFFNQEAPYFTSYGYMVVDPITGYVGNIENIDLEGEYDGDCGYENLRKKFTFNGDTVDFGGSQDYYLISK